MVANTTTLLAHIYSAHPLQPAHYALHAWYTKSFPLQHIILIHSITANFLVSLAKKCSFNVYVNALYTLI